MGIGFFDCVLGNEISFWLDVKYKVSFVGINVGVCFVRFDVDFDGMKIVILMVEDL